MFKFRICRFQKDELVLLADPNFNTFFDASTFPGNPFLRELEREGMGYSTATQEIMQRPVLHEVSVIGTGEVKRTLQLLKDAVGLMIETRDYAYLHPNPTVSLVETLLVENKIPTLGVQEPRTLPADAMFADMVCPGKKVQAHYGAFHYLVRRVDGKLEVMKRGVGTSIRVVLG